MGNSNAIQTRVGPGFYPSLMHQLSVPEDQADWDGEPPPSLTHTVEVMAKMKRTGRGKKYNLMAQVIPIYGFGILLYILYIIYKLTCKGKTNKSRSCSAVSNTYVTNTIPTSEELIRLQERLLQTEMMMERIVSGKSHSSSSRRRRKSKTSITKKEEKLLKQLRQITLLIQEGRLEGASPEMEAEEVPYDADWEGYPEETYPEYDEPCTRRTFDRIKLEEPPSQPTAEALAERMEQEEEEIMARKLSIVQEEDEDEEDREEDDEDVDEEEEVEDEEEEVEELEGIEDEEERIEEGKEEDEQEEEEDEDEEGEKKPLLSPRQPGTEPKQERAGLEVSKELRHHSGGKKQIRFSAQKRVFHYPKEDTLEEEEEESDDVVEEEDVGTEGEEEEEADDDDDDPLMEAESLQFGCEGSSNPEAEQGQEENLLTSVPVEGEGYIHADVPKEVGVSGLRMRNRRET